jgi:hypothetical protein
MENARANDKDRYVLAAQPGRVAGAAKNDKHALTAHRPQRPAQLRSPQQEPLSQVNRYTRPVQRFLPEGFSCPDTQAGTCLRAAKVRPACLHQIPTSRGFQGHSLPHHSSGVEAREDHELEQLAPDVLL